MKISDKAFYVLNITTAICFIIFIPLQMLLGARASSSIVFSILIFAFVDLSNKGELELL